MVIKIKTTDNLSNDLKKTLEGLGGIGAFVKGGEKVFVKPNFNTSDPCPASSDPEFVRAVLKEIDSQKPAQIFFGESPTFFGHSKKYFDEINPYVFEQEFKNLKVLYLPDEEWVEKENPKAKFLKKGSIPKIIDEVDKIIYLPCLKTHAWGQFTGALKLSVGLLKPEERVKMHASHLQEKIAEINLLVKPDLIIMDARKCFINRGPCEGPVREPKLILASTNRTELDIEAIKIIQSYTGNSLEGLDPREIRQIKHAIELGIS